ncbi:MAG TPA: septum formation initiator family protein [Candidatus Cryosericum sp.]|nr:septum formation initiator family protein [Candidatus Cryosericum sp.]
MVQRQERRRHRLNRRKVASLLACVLLGYLVWSTIAALVYLGKADREATRTFAELQEASAQTLAQQKALAYHKTRAYVEQVAREDLLMSKKGDTVILFPVTPPAPEPIPEPTSGLPHVLDQLVTWVRGWF